MMTAVLVMSSAGRVTAQGSNEFKTVAFGTQVWMLKNLDVSRFRNGDPIPEARTAEQWEQAHKQGKPAWCCYDNDAENCKKYGKLYNWYAVSDPRGLAPDGWHIPGRDEFIELTDQLGGHRAAGTKMKSAEGWACGGNGTIESGYTGLPAGIRSHEGDFQYLGQYAYWWTSDEYNELYAYYRYLYWHSSKLFPYVNFFKGSGFSVRCIRN
jgi:uncharacterized protein (TIGR02145 family)